MNKTHPFHLHHNRAISETRTNLNIKTKDAPIAPTWEITRALGAVCQKPQMMTKIGISYCNQNTTTI